MVTAGVHAQPGCRCAACVWAVSEAVWIVSTLVADSLPGVTEAGANVAVAPVGKPVALSVTALLKSPFTSPTDTV